MIRTIAIALATSSVALGLLAVPVPEAAAQEVRSLRGELAVTDTGPPPVVTRQRLYDGRLPREYKKQIPLVPHKIGKYEVDLKVNQCLRCHGRAYYEKEEAPKISDSHYLDRDGRTLTELARSRWFCSQCHVPQADINPLITNVFEPSAEPAGETTSGAEQ